MRRLRTSGLRGFLAAFLLAAPITGLGAATVAWNDKLAVKDEIARVISPIPGNVNASDDAALVALGKRLFSDSRLSGKQDVSCASCHRLDMGGADGKSSARPEYHINTPGIFNVRFYDRFYWNGRVLRLEDQADEAISSPEEMGGDWSRVVNLVRTDPAYNALFATVFGTDPVDKGQIISAIVAYERSLVSADARFDRYLAGDLAALDSDEVNGLKLFLDYGCIACHQGLNIGTNLFQKLGVIVPYTENDAVPDGADRYNVTGRTEDLQRVRVPSLRNVALTKPYLHDGSVPKLENVVEIMFRHQLGREPTPTDIYMIVKFLKSLTGRPPA